MVMVLEFHVSRSIEMVHRAVSVPNSYRCAASQSAYHKKFGAAYGFSHIHAEGKIRGYSRRQGTSGAMCIARVDSIGFERHKLAAVFKEQIVGLEICGVSVAPFKKHIAASHATECERLLHKVMRACESIGLAYVGCDDFGHGEKEFDHAIYGIGSNELRSGCGEHDGIYNQV